MSSKVEQQPLVEKKESSQGSAKIEALCNLFTNADIYNGKSKASLEGMGYTKGVAKSIEVNLESGLDENNKADLDKRRNLYGNNVPAIREAKTLLDFIMECFQDKILLLLLGASVVSLIIGIIEEGLATGWIEGTAIFFAVFIVVSITAVNNYQKELQFVKLSKENAKKQVKVKRNGQVKLIEVDDLLVGDVMRVEPGNIIPVDAVVIEGQFTFDESNMNGESEHMKKVPLNDSTQDQPVADAEKGKAGFKINPFCVSGTSCVTGEGFVLVLAVGEHSIMGKASKAMQIEEKPTPLQEKLSELADHIGDFGFYSAALIVMAIVFKDLIVRMYYGRAVFTETLVDTCLNAFIVGITVIVVAIPEGLPMAVTISLAYSVFKMKEENNLVRRIEAGETMGGVDTICSDKTGTLTEGTMVIVEMLIGQERVTVNSLKRKENVKIHPKNLELLNRAIYNNQESMAEKNDKGELIFKGQMTDNAMLKYLYDINIDLKSIEEKKISCLPFDSKYKFMSTLRIRNDKEHHLYFKGAPEFLIDQGRVSHYYDKDGNKQPFDENAKKVLKENQSSFADNSMRTILILHKTIAPEEVQNYSEPKVEQWDKDDQLKNFSIVGMVGIQDPPRNGVGEVIKQLNRDSGITVRMVTGDNIRTAIAISFSIGILKEHEYKCAHNYVISLESIELKRSEAKTKLTELEKQGDKASPQELKQIKDKIAEIDAEDAKLHNESTLYALEGTKFEELVGGYWTEYDRDEEAKKSGNITEQVRKNLDEKDKMNKEEIKKFEEDQKKRFILKRPEDFRKYTRYLKVIARASPQNKFLKVIGLKEQGSVVAVTGDGTNDAPALKASDVGFAMGKRGTDTAKEAAHIILLNEDFKSIVTAVMYGRNVFDCIRKFLQFQLTTNVVAVFMTLLGAIVLKDSPLNAIQMLWLNLIMDSFGSLALATEPPRKELLLRKPYKRDDNAVTPMMLFNIISQAIFQILVLVIILFYGDTMFNIPSDRDLSHFEWNDINGYHFTIFFHIFVLMQVFNSINARKLKKEETNIFEGIMNNNLYLMIQVAIVVCQVTIVTFGGRALRVKRLSVLQHVACILIASLSLLVGYICKKLPFSFEEDDKKSVYGNVVTAVGKTSFRKSLRGGDGSKGVSALSVRLTDAK